MSNFSIVSPYDWCLPYSNYFSTEQFSNNFYRPFQHVRTVVRYDQYHSIQRYYKTTIIIINYSLCNILIFIYIYIYLQFNVLSYILLRFCFVFLNLKILSIVCGCVEGVKIFCVLSSLSSLCIYL